MKKVEQPRKPMLIYAFCVLILLLLVNLLLMPAITGQALQSVDYSTFLNMVKEGEVSKAQIETDYIYFEDKEEPVNIYRTATFNDPELVNRLDEAGCSFGRVVDRQNPWLMSLLSFFAPLILFYGVGAYVSKQLMKNSGGVSSGNPFLSFGRSNAKGHRQNPAGQGRRRRGGRAVFLHRGLRVCGDVCGHGRQ